MRAPRTALLPSELHLVVLRSVQQRDALLGNLGDAPGQLTHNQSSFYCCNGGVSDPRGRCANANTRRKPLHEPYTNSRYDPRCVKKNDTKGRDDFSGRRATDSTERVDRAKV
jgi:hypothetical protein